MKNKKLSISIILLILIGVGVFYFSVIRGIYVEVTNRTELKATDIQISCRGFSENIDLNPGETKKIKLKFTNSGDNSLHIIYSSDGEVKEDRFGYFEGFPYKGLFELDYTENGIELINENITINIL